MQKERSKSHEIPCKINYVYWIAKSPIPIQIWRLIDNSTNLISNQFQKYRRNPSRYWSRETEMKVAERTYKFQRNTAQVLRLISLWLNLKQNQKNEITKFEIAVMDTTVPGPFLRDADPNIRNLKCGLLLLGICLSCAYGNIKLKYGWRIESWSEISSKMHSKLGVIFVLK